MEGEIAQGSVGEVGKYDVKFVDGKLVVEVSASIAIGEAGVVVKVDAAHVIDALAAAIPGKVDDAVLGVIKAAVLGK